MFPLFNIFPRVCFDGEGASSSVPITEPNKQTQQTDQNQQQQNNTSDNNQDDVNLDDIWNPVADNTQDDANKQTQTVDEDAAQASFQKHLDSINFMDGIDFADMEAKIREGDFGAMQTFGKTIAQNAYRRALFDGQRLIKEQVSRAVADAVKQARGETSVDMAITRMRSEIPFAKDPILSPIADQALKQFLRRGQDIDTAIGNVRKAFDAMGSRISGKGKVKNQGFNPDRQNTSSNSDETEELDFMSIFSGEEGNNG